MVRKTLYLLFFWIVFVPTGSAQTIQWVVKPHYDTISYLNSSVFKCKRGDGVQLVNTKGRELLTPAADSVTNFCENRLLVLDKKGNKYKIRGIIDEFGVFTIVHDELFVNNYSFCSDGLISVLDQSDKAGYIDVGGNLVIPCKYRKARPFIQGWASVEPAKGKKHTRTLYINTKGDVMKIHGFHNGKVVMGSSFNSSGEALVAYYDNDNAVINTRGEVKRKYEKQNDLIPIRTYDFSFDQSGNNSIPNTSPDIFFDTDYVPFMIEKKMGYEKNGRIVVPPQFSEAEGFVNGFAIVCMDNKYGIVRLVDGSFSGEFIGEDLAVATGKEIPTYSYTLVIPESLLSESLDVKFDVGDGHLQSLKPQEGKYEFTPFIEENADFCLMKMQVISDGLLLWADTLKKTVNNVSLDISAPEALSEWANEYDELRVHSVFTNNSNSTITVSGIFFVNFAKGSKNKMGQKKSFWGKIAPQGTLDVYADLIVVEEETAKVVVSVKVNQKHNYTKSAIIQLKPFD